MKQVKMILDFLLVLASCFFRSKKQQSGNPPIPPPPDCAGHADGRKGNCAGSTGNADHPVSTQSAASTLMGWSLILAAGSSLLYRRLG